MEFGEVYDDPQYRPYVDLIFNAAHADIMGNTAPSVVDSESYEEIRQISMTLEEGFVDPES